MINNISPKYILCLLSLLAPLLLVNQKAVANTVSNKSLVVDMVKVDKSSRKMYLTSGRKIVKVFDISLGGNPAGHKIQLGDKRTPEGTYSLTYINEKSKYYRSMYINYPNENDIKVAKERGLHPGGHIVVHGQKNFISNDPEFKIKSDWTNGCIALSNVEMDEFLSLVSVGTPIKISW